MVHQTSNRHIQAVLNNLKFVILDYLAAKKSAILTDAEISVFCDWSISSPFIWKVMSSMPGHESTIHSEIMLHTRTLNTDQQTETVVRRRALSVMVNVICCSRVWRNIRFYDKSNVANSFGPCYPNPQRSLVVVSISAGGGGTGDASAPPKVLIWWKSLKIWAKSVEIWAKSVKTFAKSEQTPWKYWQKWRPTCFDLK